MVDVSSVWDCLPLAFSTPVNWQHRQQNSPAITKWWIASAIQREFCPELNSGSSKKTARNPCGSKLMARGIKTWTDLMKETRFDSSIVEGLTKHLRSRDEQEREAYTADLESNTSRICLGGREPTSPLFR